jgi:hypothetical protein
MRQVLVIWKLQWTVGLNFLAEDVRLDVSGKK